MRRADACILQASACLISVEAAPGAILDDPLRRPEVVAPGGGQALVFQERIRRSGGGFGGKAGHASTVRPHLFPGSPVEKAEKRTAPPKWRGSLLWNHQHDWVLMRKNGQPFGSVRNRIRETETLCVTYILPCPVRPRSSDWGRC